MGTVRDDKLGGLFYRSRDFRGQNEVEILQRHKARVKTVSSQRTAVVCG